MTVADSVIEWRYGPSLPEVRPRTLAELISAAIVAHAERPLLIAEGAQWSWPALDQAAGRLAAYWADDVAPGDRVVLTLGNRVEHLVCELAAWRLAAIAVPLDSRQNVCERDAHLAALRPAVVVGDPPAIGPWLATPLQAVRVVMARDGAVLPWRAAQPATPALILTTSGSTGQPRRPVLTHDNICSQQAAFAMLWPEVGADDRLAAYLPWHHSFGALAERLWALVRGAELHVVHYDPNQRDAFVDAVRQVAPTIFCSVPRLHRLMAERQALDPQALRFAFTAGAALPADVRALYASQGITVHEGWGATETSPACTIAVPVVHAGVVGPPIPGVAVGVRAHDHHVVVRGPNIMAGYWADDDATQSVLSDDIFDTGDCGQWTEHGLLLEGRSDASIKLTNGEKLPVARLEHQLVAIDGVHEAVVTVVGRVVVAVVETTLAVAEMEAARVELNRHCQRPWQRIDHVVCCCEPDTQHWTTTGKPDRQRWQALAQSALATCDAHVIDGEIQV